MIIISLPIQSGKVSDWDSSTQAVTLQLMTIIASILKLHSHQSITGGNWNGGPFKRVSSHFYHSYKRLLERGNRLY